MIRRTVVVAALLLSVSAAARQQMVPDLPHTAGELERIARELPCTAAALLHVMNAAQTPGNGVLYLDSPPSTASVLALIRQGTATAGYPELRQNPYASTPYVVEIQWQNEKGPRETALLSFRVRLSTRYHGLVRPVHLLERESRVLFSSHTLKLLPPVSRDGAGI